MNRGFEEWLLKPRNLITSERIVLIVIAMRADMRTHKFAYKKEIIAEDTGLSGRTVENAMKTLIKKELLIREGKESYYTIYKINRKDEF